MRLLAPLASMVGVILLVIVVFRARRVAGTTPIVRIALIISAAWAGISLFWGIVRTVMWFQPGIGITFTVRTEPFWPASEDAGVSGGFSSAQLTAIDVLSTPARAWLATGQLVETLVAVALSGLVAVACFRFLQGRPFAPELARLSLVAAVTSLAGGLIAQALQQYGGTRALAELAAVELAPRGVQAASVWTIEWWPVWLAIGLGALAAFLRYGTRLQRDTDGLV